GVAAGDINGDGRIDIVAGQGPGGSSRVKVFEGLNVATIGDFRAFNKSFGGGVFVGTGNIKGFAFDDIIIGQGPGGRSQVKVFSNRMAMMMPHAKDLNLSLVASFRAYRPRYQGGVRVTSLHDSTPLPIYGGNRDDVVTTHATGEASAVRIIPQTIPPP